jgi:hypothetical protein
MLAKAIEVFLFGGDVPVLEQHLVDVDLERAYLGTIAAKAGGIAEMLELLHALDMRRDHGADGAAVRSAISMTANILVHRAGVETGAAANAVHAFAYFFTQKVCAAVVEQYHVHLVGSVGLSLPAGAGEYASVYGNMLTGTVRGPAGARRVADRL